MGKAVWKLQAIPALLFGKQVITLSKKVINKLQVIENGVYRYLLGVNDTTPVTTLRGEVGASKIESRVMETVMTFTSETLQGKFNKVKDYMKHDLETAKGRWAKTVDRYRQETGLSWNDMTEINKKDMKNKIKDRDTRIWRENMEEKDTLKWYKEDKRKIQYDQC